MTDEQKTQAVIQHMVRHVSRGVDSIGGHLEGGRFNKQQLQQELMTAYIQFIDMSAAMNLSDTDHNAVYSFMGQYQRQMRETAGWTSEDMLRFVALCDIRRREYLQCMVPSLDDFLRLMATSILKHVDPDNNPGAEALTATMIHLSFLYKFADGMFRIEKNL